MDQYLAVIAAAATAVAEGIEHTGRPITAAAAIMVVVLVSVLPMIFEWVKHRKRAKALVKEAGDIVDHNPDN